MSIGLFCGLLQVFCCLVSMIVVSLIKIKQKRYDSSDIVHGMVLGGILGITIGFLLLFGCCEIVNRQSGEPTGRIFQVVPVNDNVSISMSKDPHMYVAYLDDGDIEFLEIDDKRSRVEIGANEKPYVAEVKKTWWFIYKYEYIAYIHLGYDD